MRSFANVLCLMLILTGTVHAGDTSATLTPLSVSWEQSPFHSREPMNRVYVTAESGRFTFVIPLGFQLRGDPAKGKLKFSNMEGNCEVTFAILDPAPCEGRELNTETYRGVVQGRHPQGKILEEFTRPALSRNCPAFDIQWETTNKLTLRMRTVFVPSVAGVLEFTASSSPKNFPALQYQLMQLMANLQATTPDGKLQVPRISDADSRRSDAASPKRHEQDQILVWSGSARSAS